MDADLKLLSEQLDELIDWHSQDGKLKAPYTVQVLLAAKVQITRLRAQAFRWIPVGERMPAARDVNKFGIVVHPQCYAKDWYLGAGNSVSFDHRITHWSPIPPLPEQSQAEKDEELWRKHLGTADAAYVDSYAREIAHLGFIQGLKAARGEKL